MNAVSDREAIKREFLAAARLADARREPLAGDASTRAYERLYPANAPPLILMDAPPSSESAPCRPDATQAERTAAGYNATARLAASRVDAFAATSNYLRGRGLSAPEIVALDVPTGLAVVEDLGPDLFARRIAAGEPSAPLYATAIDLLIDLHRESPPNVLPLPEGGWPLLTYDDLALKTGADVFLEWWPKFSGAPPITPDAAADWERLWAPIRARGEAGATVFTHRDYHAENLIWLDGRKGLARVGLLDFQDAVRGHPAWDLFSLLQDARRDVPEALEAAMLDRYLAARPDLDRAAFLQDYAGLAALNNSRILGVFARLIARDGKPRYAEFLPRMSRLLARNLDAPGLAPLKGWFAAHGGLETPA
ncbi:MAG: N-acetylmuramate/N-acetylglucosamine kinase AmgK [Caulobacteraceae bacterium]